MKPVGKAATHLLLATGLLPQAFPTVAAQQQSPSANEGYGYGYGVNSDLASRLQAPPIKNQEALSQALKIVHAMESAPTCNRLAALNLINDCKSLEHNSNSMISDSEMVLDEVKSEYAARLAVCELLGAKALVPRECAILVPSPQACGKGRFSSFFSRQKKDSAEGEYCYPEATHAQFERCLGSLESRPQSWTSYSNARQNAVVMCHASRDAIDRERNLAVYKSLTEVVEQMTYTLASSLQDMQTWVAEQMSFTEKIRLSQEQAIHNMQENRDVALASFDTVKGTLHSLTGMVKQAAEALTQGLDETLYKSKASIEAVREDMQGLYRDLAEASSQHSVVQKNQLQAHHEVALASLQVNHETAVYSLDTLSRSITTLQDQVDVSSKSIENLNRGLESLNKTVESLGGATESLRTTIDATTEALHVLTTLSGMAANPKLWVAVIISIFGLWNANRKIAGYFMATLGFSGTLYILGIHKSFEVLFGYARNPRVPEPHSLPKFLANRSLTSLFLPGVAIICLLSAAIWSFCDSTCLYKYHDDQSEDGILPNIEAPGGPATPAPRIRHAFNPFSAFRPRS